MSKKTLANELRRMAWLIESLPEECDIDVDFYSHGIKTSEPVLQRLEGLGGIEEDANGHHWTKFSKMNDEPINFTVFTDFTGKQEQVES